MKIGVALSDPGYPSDHSLELVAWGTMRPQLGSIPERGGDCCPSSDQSTPILLQQSSLQDAQQLIFCIASVLWGPLSLC